jgi:hypothetical protein
MELKPMASSFFETTSTAVRVLTKTMMGGSVSMSTPYMIDCARARPITIHTPPGGRGGEHY